MSSSSSARVGFTDFAIRYIDDDGVDHCFDYGTIADMQKRLNELVDKYPDRVYIRAKAKNGEVDLRLRLTGPVRVDSDKSFKHPSASDKPSLIERLSGRRIEIVGPVIYGSASDMRFGSPVWYTLWPHLNKGAYVNSSNFAYVDDNGVMIRRLVTA